MKINFTFLVFTVSVLISIYVQAQTPGEIGAVITIDSYEDFQGYDESAAYTGQGEYQIYYDNIDGVLDKPLIICDGFDPGDSRAIASIYGIGDYGTANMFDELRDLGMDVILLNFPNYDRDGETIDGGADYIERNGLVMVNLIETIKTDMTGSEELIIMGPSMGGLITRYALTYMEEDVSLDHQTALWISFDSPQRGANTPISFQYAINYFAEFNTGNADMAALRDEKLNTAAAKQMLLDHYSAHLQDGEDFEQDTAIQLPTPNPFRNTFMSTMDALGFPQQTRNISLVNGSLSGNMVESPGVVLLDGIIDLDSASADMTLHFTPSANTSDFNVDNIVIRVYGFVVGTFDAVAESPSYTAGLDSTPGGTVLFDSYFGENPSETEQQVIDALQVDEFSFIPVLSSLAIDEQNWYDPVTGTETIPFDAYFGPTENEPHLTLSTQGRDFLMDEITTILSTDNYYVDLEGIKLMENPSKDFVRIQFSSDFIYDNVQMSLFTMTGQEIQKVQLSNPHNIVALNAPANSGIYFLQISEGNRTITKKVIIE